MGLANGDLSAADVAAVVGNRNDGFGDFGGNSVWIIILFLFALMNGWGNNGVNNGNNVPYGVQAGFDQSAIMNGFATTNAAIGNIGTAMNAGFANAESAAASRQMATMNQNFANQTAMNQGFNTIASQLANCCCENRLATANLSADLARESCADRAAVNDALTSVLTQMNAGVQSIKDQMCQDKIDAKNEQIAALQQQLALTNLAASQNAQTAQILANNDAQTAALEQYLAPTARPAWIVPSPCGCNNYSYGLT